MEKIELNAPSLKGEIYIGRGAAKERLPRLTEGQRNFVVTDSNVFSLYGTFFSEYFAKSEIFVLPAGEESKNFEALSEILTRMTRVGLHRTSRLFAVGGGVVGDIGGLAAALYMRGISCVQVPTTLLAQVDSGVGGKTAVDLCGVNNIVGAFHQPCEVVADPDFLSTLPPREIKCGLGEIVKYAALNEEIFDRLKALENINVCESGGAEFLTSLLAPCIKHKARVVEADEKETGERKSLNVGHTTGHALELSYSMSHGESVLWGMWFETALAVKYGVCGEEYGGELMQIVRRALAVPPRQTPDFDTIGKAAEKARSDKKNTDDGLIQMAVAADRGKWAMLSLPFPEYRDGLELLAAQWKNGGGTAEDENRMLR